MGTVISIETLSVPRIGHGRARQLSGREIGALATACSGLLEHVGRIRYNVEVIKVTPWFAYDSLNSFDVKVVLSLGGDPTAKLQATVGVFEDRRDRSPGIHEWDYKVLVERIQSEMPRRIRIAVKKRARDLERVAGAWKELVPEMPPK